MSSTALPAQEQTAAQAEPEQVEYAGRSANSAFSSLFFSLLLHIVFFGPLILIPIAQNTDLEDVLVESIFAEDRVQEEYTQELEQEMQVSENLNPISGGAVTTKVGANTGPTQATTQARIETSQSLREADFVYNAGDITTPGDSMLGVDLGQGEVTGEIGAVVEGYGPALSRLTQEIARMMREEPVLVVWMFDESESMQDDQKEIRDKFYKVYEELGLLVKKDQEEKKSSTDVLMTMILSYGKELHTLTPKPTTNLEEIKAAINKIPLDDSGLENMCGGLQEVIRKYGVLANRDRPKRKLVVVMVSDESGDDGEKVELAVKEAERFGSPIYILARESVFGFPIARLRWKDDLGLTHWLPINRGPETARRECLQWDGLHRRWDSDSAGFGPYEMVRLSKMSGGVFFLLPGEEENLASRESQEARKFKFMDMKKYVPELDTRDSYDKDVARSRFRTEISRVITVLDPEKDTLLSIRSEWYPLEKAEFVEEAQRNFQKAARAVSQLNIAIEILKGIEPMRASEDSDRWRANYDLIYAQCLGYRVRLFQYMCAMDEHARNMPKPKNANSNYWDVRRVPKMIEPTDEQFARIKDFYGIKKDKAGFLKDLQKIQDESARRYREVSTNHPGTPWARRAELELRQGYGMQFVDVFRDPRYNRPNIKFPKL